MFATSILTARTLGPAGRGDFVAIITAIALISQFAGWGFSSAATLEVARRPQRANRIFAAVLTASAVGGLVGGIAVSVVMPRNILVEKGTLRAMLVCWPFVQLVNVQTQGVLLGLQAFYWFNALEILVRALTLIAAIAVVVLSAVSPLNFLIATFIVELAVALLGILVVGHRTHVTFQGSAPVLRRLFGLGARVYLLLLLPMVLVRSDIIILAALRPNTEVGLYSVAGQIVTLFLLLPQSIGQALFALLGRVSDRTEETVTTVGLAFWALVASAVFLVSAAPFALPLLFGKAYAPAYGYLVLLMPGAVALALQTVGVQYFNAQGFPLVLAAYWAIAVAVNLFLNVLFIPYFGATAAALTSTIAYALLSLLVMIRLARELGVAFATLLSPRAAHRAALRVLAG